LGSREATILSSIKGLFVGERLGDVLPLIFWIESQQMQLVVLQFFVRATTH
jgi:hypothetical protein